VVSDVAYPEPIPVLKGKAAEELVSKLFRVAKPPKKNEKWVGSREVYLKLRPRNGT
jgi:hypothetical protein